MNKFHDRKSLWAGVVAGGLVATIGVVLSLHCIDMIRYYKKHRILKIVKTDNERIIYKEKFNNNKFRVWFDALSIAWKDTSFRIWIVTCTIGIIIGLLVEVGMTSLVLLVVIALLGWGMEVANTAIETLLDIVHPKHSPKVKVVKDAFASVPKFVYSAYVISWLILVAPSLYERLFG